MMSLKRDCISCCQILWNKGDFFHPEILPWLYKSVGMKDQGSSYLEMSLVGMGSK